MSRRAPASSAGRLLLLAAVSALGLVVCAVAPVRDPQLRALAAQYIVLAESLTHGTYELTSSPLRETVVTVPPLWPAVLAGAYVAAAPASLSAFVPVAEAITIALFVGLIVTVFFFVESRMGSVPATVVASLTAVQPWLVTYARTAMAEIAFTLLLLSALRFGGTALRRRASGSLYVGLALALAAAYVRGAGIAVVLMLVLRAWSVFPERRRSLTAFAGAAFLWPLREVATLLLGTPTATTTADNLRQALAGRDALAVLGDNAAFYARGLVSAVFPTDLLYSSPGYGILLVALWTVIAVGAARDRVHDRGLATATGALILGGLLLWPSAAVRHFVPLVPLALYFSARGLRRMLQLLARTFGVWSFRPARLGPLLLLAVLLPYMRWTLGDASAPPTASSAARGWRGFTRTLEWVKTRVPRNAVLVTEYSDDVFVRTGRRALTLDHALRNPDAKALTAAPLWLVRDADDAPSASTPDAGEISRAGGRIRYVEEDSGIEVWLLPQRALQELERRRESMSHA